MAVLRPGELPVGAGRFEIGRIGADSQARRTAPFLVSFSDQLAITSYDQMISLLRYFERQEWVDKLRHATRTSVPPFGGSSTRPRTRSSPRRKTRRWTATSAASRSRISAFGSRGIPAG